MHFSKLSVRSFFPPAPFPCVAMFESIKTQKGQLHLFIHFWPRDISNITFPEMLGAYLCIFSYLEVLSFVSSYRVEAFLLTGSRSEIKNKTLFSHRLFGRISSYILEHNNESAFPLLVNNSTEPSQNRSLIQPSLIFCLRCCSQAWPFWPRFHV